jgi:amidase
LRLLCLSSLSGLPQVTIPVPGDEDAPLGLSLIGPAGSDVSLLALAARVADAVQVRIA